MPEETATATGGIRGMKDIMLEEESKKVLSLVIDEEIKQDLTNAIEKDHQKTEIPEIVGIGEIKFLMPEHEITTTPSVELASENQSDILFLDDTEYSKKTESEETETCESVDLKKGNTEQKPVTNDKLSENKVSPVDEIQSDADHSSQSTEDEQVDLKSEDSDVIKEDNGETETLPKQELSTDESKKLETEKTSDETHMPIDQVNESSEDEETLNVETTSIEEDNLAVDQGIKEEIPLTEIVASTIMNPKESSSSFVIEETSDKSEAVIEGSELTREEENHVPIAEPGSTLVANEVEEPENVLSEEDPEVQLSEAKQISDLEVTSVEEPIMPLPQAGPEVSSEASVDEVAKPAEKEQLSEESKNSVVKVSSEALVVTEESVVKATSEPLVVELSNEAPVFKTSSEALVDKASNEVLAVEVSGENSVVKVSSEDQAVEASSESEDEALQFMGPQNTQ